MKCEILSERHQKRLRTISPRAADRNK